MTKLRLVLALAGVLALIGAYSYGRVDGGKVCTGSAHTSYQKGVEKNANIDRKVDRMVEPDIDNALSSRWMH